MTVDVTYSLSDGCGEEESLCICRKSKVNCSVILRVD